MRLDTIVKIATSVTKNAYNHKSSALLIRANIKISDNAKMMIDLIARYVCFSRAVNNHSKANTLDKKFNDKMKIKDELSLNDGTKNTKATIKPNERTLMIA